MAAPLADETVAVVGLGHMGTAIAERLLADGCRTVVFNRTPGRDPELLARGAIRLARAGDALVEARVCVTSLADDGAVEGATRAVLAGAARGTTLVDTSTVSVDASRRLADAAAAAGVAYVRAPISGNPAAIRAGKAAIFVSGPDDAVAAVEPLLRAVAPTLRPVGEAEEARVVKLVLQVLVGGTAGLLAEALALGEAAGVDRADLLDAIRSSAIGSRFVDYKAEPLLRDDYSATFTTAMMVKDVDLVLDLAGSAGADLPLTRELRTLLEETCEHGHADDDFLALLPELKRRAGAGVAT